MKGNDGALVLAAAILALLIVTSGCCCAAGKKAPASTARPSASPVSVVPEGILPKGDRLLGIAATPASDDDFGRSFAMARGAGMGIVEMSLRWDEVEPAEGQYQDPDDNMASGNRFYSGQGLKIAVTLACVDTNVDRRPADLRGRPFDDPVVVERYNRAVDYVLSQLPDADIVCFAVGNEIDGTLGNDARKWAEYEAFYAKAVEHLHARRPGLKVGTKAMFGGLATNQVGWLQAMNAHSDVILATYYPLNGDFSVREPSVVRDDLGRLCALYPGKEIYLLECGYPSGALCNSSEERQAEFVRHTFAAWDQHRDQVKIVLFMWLHDVPPSWVDRLQSYYGLRDARFAAYLGTLGLRTYDGRDKPGWRTLKEEAMSRGWSFT